MQHNYKDWIRLDRDEHGFIYVPRFIKQVSDMEYGSIVSHENYNEKLNLNSAQGDYNTEVLRILFTERNADKAFHIPYIDAKLAEDAANIENTLNSFDETINALDEAVNTQNGAIETVSNTVNKIINGESIVAHAVVADKILGIDSAGIRKYYGTDSIGSVGYHDVPPAIFTGDVVGSTEILDPYYVPAVDSVTEDMLTEEVRTKLNRQSITSYPSLTDKPRINNTVLEGDLSLNDLGIQPAGNYLTAVPDTYITEDELTTTLNPYIKSSEAATTYATITSVTELSNTVNDNAILADSTYARCCVGTFEGTPKKGDLLVVL